MPVVDPFPLTMFISYFSCLDPKYPITERGLARAGESCCAAARPRGTNGSEMFIILKEFFVLVRPDSFPGDG